MIVVLVVQLFLNLSVCSNENDMLKYVFCWKGIPQTGTSESGAGYFPNATNHVETVMGFGRGALLWLIGIPLPIILLLALFMHH
jgi:hypothetical protein